MSLPRDQRFHMVFVIGITVTIQMVTCSTSWSRISNAVVNDLLSENLRQPLISLPGYHGKETRQENAPPFQRNDECSRNLTDLYVQSSGTIRTPNYPNNYPARSQCEWVFESEPGTGSKQAESDNRPSNSDSKLGLWSANKQNFQRGNSVHRIVGGSEVTPHQYPFMAALLMDDKYFCGGSLIDRQHVLTAAHCVESASKIEVFLGSHDLTDEEDSRQYQSVNSSYILQHPGFDSKTGANDIAIIRLAELVTFDRHVQPVYLPSPESMSNSFTGYQLTTMGWGEANKSRENPSISPVLRKASASIIPNSVCKQTFKDVITGNVMCSSGSRGDSPCHGDSGSPLVAEFRSIHNLDSTNSTNHHQCVYSDSRKSTEAPNGTNWFVQLGILSIGSSSCGSSAPTAFTRLTAYIDFIRHAQTLTLKNFKL
ncbi:unnamed protein product [Allacma fusca]|uniref:Uncharacterized protein n=1 Tax=Allacma fusca TaxID=39272 RepID=A0A8J2LCG9_9HEXA|nr:unnamed protein product [Allacma fusca]